MAVNRVDPVPEATTRTRVDRLAAMHVLHTQQHKKVPPACTTVVKQVFVLRLSQETLATLHKAYVLLNHT